MLAREDTQECPPGRASLLHPASRHAQGALRVSVQVAEREFDVPRRPASQGPYENGSKGANRTPIGLTPLSTGWKLEQTRLRYKPMP